VNTRRLGGAYQGAVEATLAVVISVFGGAWADSKFGTSPTFLFLGLGVGFGAFILRLTRLLREAGEESGGETAPDNTPPNESAPSESVPDKGTQLGRESSGRPPGSSGDSP
jgi:F0F1-type ATP synthase assembly protein I